MDTAFNNLSARAPQVTKGGGGGGGGEKSISKLGGPGEKAQNMKHSPKKK